MITVAKICFLRLQNNPYEMALTFAVPIVFFSIFAMIFTRGIDLGQSSIRVAIVDDDQSTLTSQLVQRLSQESSVQLLEPTTATNEAWPRDRLARALLIEGQADVVIYFPAGVESQLRRGAEFQVPLLLEGTNPLARDLLQGLLKSAMSLAASDIAGRSPAGQAGDGAPGQPSLPGPDLSRGEITAVDLFAAEKSHPKIASYAAGIAVMFLLFSATAAGGSLLEEFEAGTLERLLASRLRISELLAGKWLYTTALGCGQLTVMFLWAQLAFAVDLAGHLQGFAAMTIATSAASASLGMCLATACRSRTQLNAVSIVLILAMSALGGSMIPRFIMSPELQQWGRLTFNAWALDGFQKVFWYDLPVRELATELAVLLGASLILGLVARILAVRWQAD